MKRLSIALLLLVLVASACRDEADAPAISETGATTTFTLVDGSQAAEDPVQLVPGSITAGVLLVDDIVREYLVAVPPDYSADTPAPLLFDLHGRGGTAPGQAMTSRVTDLAWAKGFVVVHPQAMGEVTTWSVWPELPELSTDVAFFDLMIDAIADELSIDLDRVFVMGFSNGGGMAGRLVCELPDRIRAIAPVGASNEGWLQCDPGRPIPVLAIHGFDDPVIPFNGGQALLPELSQWAAWWAQSNGCGAGMEPVAVPTGTFWHWPECNEGATVSLIGLEGVGHEWPLLVQSVAVDDELVWVGATEVIVDFFAGL